MLQRASTVLLFLSLSHKLSPKTSNSTVVCHPESGQYSKTKVSSDIGQQPQDGICNLPSWWGALRYYHPNPVLPSEVFRFFGALLDIIYWSIGDVSL